MFRYEVNAFREAERRVRVQSGTGGFYITLDDDRRLTQSTKDEVQIRHWQRVLVVNIALLILGRVPSPTAGMLSTNTYSAFAYEVEKRNA